MKKQFKEAKRVMGRYETFVNDISKTSGEIEMMEHALNVYSSCRRETKEILSILAGLFEEVEKSKGVDEYGETEFDITVEEEYIISDFMLLYLRNQELIERAITAMANKRK